MTKAILNVAVRKSAKKLLVNRSKATGKSMGELTEFALVNMPFIPSKKTKGDIK